MKIIKGYSVLTENKSKEKGSPIAMLVVYRTQKDAALKGHKKTYKINIII